MTAPTAGTSVHSERLFPNAGATITQLIKKTDEKTTFKNIIASLILRNKVDKI